MKIRKIILGITFLFLSSCIIDPDKLAQNGLYPVDEANQSVTPEYPTNHFEQRYLKVQTDQDQIEVHVWYYNADSKENVLENKPVIIFHHGNGDTIGELNNNGILENFKNLGFNFVVFDYPGYGRSQGQPSQKTILDSAQTVFNWTHNQFPRSKIIIWGWSLGSAVALQVTLKNQKNISALVLNSPFKNFKTMAIDRFGDLAKLISKKWASKNSWDSYSTAPHIKVPVLITHGTQDEEIPFHFGQELFGAFKNNVAQFKTLEGKTHDSFFADINFWKDISDFIQQHEQHDQKYLSYEETY